MAYWEAQALARSSIQCRDSRIGDRKSLTRDLQLRELLRREKNARAFHNPGRKDADGKFYPHVFAKVTNDVNGKWETIAELGVTGRRMSRRIAGNSVDDQLVAQLDVFRSKIGDYTYGSLVLPTGEAAVFELRDLLPPESASSPKSAITPQGKN